MNGASGSLGIEKLLLVIKQDKFQIIIENVLDYPVIAKSVL